MFLEYFFKLGPWIIAIASLIATYYNNENSKKSSLKKGLEIDRLDNLILELKKQNSRALTDSRVREIANEINNESNEILKEQVKAIKRISEINQDKVEEFERLISQNDKKALSDIKPYFEIIKFERINTNRIGFDLKNIGNGNAMLKEIKTNFSNATSISSKANIINRYKNPKLPMSIMNNGEIKRFEYNLDWNSKIEIEIEFIFQDSDSNLYHQVLKGNNIEKIKDIRVSLTSPKIK